MNQEETWLLKEKYSCEQTEQFVADCARLRAGEPLSYLIGSIPFLNTTIHLDSRPLIPRPETEFWVEKAIEKIKQKINRGETPILSMLRVLDLCAGSGAIGVAVLHALPQVLVTFAEIDSVHLSTIEKNILKNTIIYDSEKYLVVGSDLFEKVTGKFDFILTNPPYIDKDANSAEKSVTDHEPHLALFGGKDGMECIARIITDAPKHLTAEGELWMEHEPAQAEAIVAMAEHNKLHASIHNDQYGIARYSIMTMAQ